MLPAPALCIAVLCLLTCTFGEQIPFYMASEWKVELSSDWDVLGPFPIYAREQHFLDPSFPIDVSAKINYNATYPSSYADGGRVSWTKASSQDNVLEVVFPESVRWKALRDIEGWAAVQHHAVLKASITVYPDNSNSHPPRNLRIQLTGGSYFTILPSSPQTNFIEAPRWYSGNIYDMERALPRVVDLPSVPSADKPTSYDIFVSGDYEIRLFGDPRAQRNSDIPAQRIKLDVQFDAHHTKQVVWESTQDVVPNFLSGWTFGDALGVGLRAKDGWWSVTMVQFMNPDIAEYLSLVISSTKFRLAPTQARILPLRIEQHKALPPDFKSIDIIVTLEKLKPDVSITTLEVVVSLPITHLAMWDASSSASNPVIKGSYFFGVSDSMPTNFLAVPPRFEGKGQIPILALHGAGVDIFTPTPQESFWAQALPRQDRSWVIIPSGRTSWGLDWHGPSAQDAWMTLDAVAKLVQDSLSTWGGERWGIPSPNGRRPQAILMGHSNGGQGAWYLSERFPDRVLGVIAASAYMKSQSYVPWSMSRSAHFVDPFLEAILQTSLTPDNNDLFLSNLQKSVLALHGDADENVPVWHSRELVGVLESLRGDNVDSNTSRLEYQELPNQPHWFPLILKNDPVQSFINELLNSSDRNEDGSTSESFRLTIALPAESSSMRGWRVEKLTVPGRLGHISIQVKPSTSHLSVHVETTNIIEFSVNTKVFGALSSDTKLWIDGTIMHLDAEMLGAAEVVYFRAREHKTWKLYSVQNTLQLSGRAQTILSSPYDSEGLPAPLVFVVADPASDPETTVSQTPHAMSVALRLAHDLMLYHRLDSEIIFNSEVGFASSKTELASVLGKGNVVVVGDNAAMGLRSTLNEIYVNDDKKNTFMSVEEFVEKVKGIRGSPEGPELHPGEGFLFLHPHPMNPFAKMLLLQSTDTSDTGLERVTRLFPIRTGVPVPDWIIVGGDGSKGEANVVAAGLWDSEWSWNEAMSWSSTL